MSANRHRGEISASFDGKPYRLRLTLGALAELEDAFAAEDLGALVARFGSGRISASDIIRILAAGLRGAGHALSDDEVRQLRCDDGAAGFARVVAELLTATFGAAKEGSRQDP